MRKGLWMAGGAGMLIGAAAAAAVMTGGAGVADPERQRIEQIVREYILANPEIIPEAIEKLRSKESTRAVSTNLQRLQTPFAGAWAGAANGDVVLVQFYDYACGYCRTAAPDIQKLLAEDPKLKVVFRELPILGPDSNEAAKTALAAARQGQAQFLAYHQAVFAGGRLTPRTMAAAATRAKLDAGRTERERAAADIDSELRANLDLARALGISGTPVFVVGDRILNGAVGYDALKQAIAEVRTKG